MTNLRARISDAHPDRRSDGNRSSPLCGSVSKEPKPALAGALPCFLQNEPIANTDDYGLVFLRVTARYLWRRTSKIGPRLAGSRLRGDRPGNRDRGPLLTGQYKSPIRVVAYNNAERWSEDVSEDVAYELRRRCDLQLRDIPSNI